MLSIHFDFTKTFLYRFLVCFPFFCKHFLQTFVSQIIVIMSEPFEHFIPISPRPDTSSVKSSSLPSGASSHGITSGPVPSGAPNPGIDIGPIALGAPSHGVTSGPIPPGAPGFGLLSLPSSISGSFPQGVPRPLPFYHSRPPYYGSSYPPNFRPSSNAYASPHQFPTNDEFLYQKVIEYLVKKGYNRTEQMLRSESANLDRDGKPIQDRAEDLGTAKYSKGFRLLSNWIESNLDIYKVSKKLFFLL